MNRISRYVGVVVSTKMQKTVTVAVNKLYIIKLIHLIF